MLPGLHDLACLCLWSCRGSEQSHQDLNSLQSPHSMQKLTPAIALEAFAVLWAVQTLASIAEDLLESCVLEWYTSHWVCIFLYFRYYEFYSTTVQMLLEPDFGMHGRICDPIDEDGRRAYVGWWKSIDGITDIQSNRQALVCLSTYVHIHQVMLTLSCPKVEKQGRVVS